MIQFFKKDKTVFAVQSAAAIASEDVKKLEWLFSGAELFNPNADSYYVGPRREMITPWSTNAVEITQNMGMSGVERIEEFHQVDSPDVAFDKMLSRMYHGLDGDVFTITRKADPIVLIDDIEAYNLKQGLALVGEEIDYLNGVAKKLGRKLTDSEVFGFSQVNSEHCRHKIFNGQFIIDGLEKPDTLFKMIRRTTDSHVGAVVSAYKDNCAFLQGPVVEQFAPVTHVGPDYFATEDFESVITIKAETHNFPTTVEPFNGAATGTGGEIRDRIAGGKGAFPVSGTACYMTAYPRLRDGQKVGNMDARAWLYQTPADILIKASNGASDFGNKFGQPLICGSLFTFEHAENGKQMAFDKVIMLAGGIGYGKKVDSLKDDPQAGEKVVLLGGDNYRIGMGGGAVSSVATGQYEGAIELNAIQRSNPEMQKRVYNAIRAISEEANNPIVSIHDHGAGGHLNCLSELVETTGGRIDIDQLPVGDPTLSYKEIVGNESQERMGLVIRQEYVEKLGKIAARERAPMYVVGDTTGDMRFTFLDNRTGDKPLDMPLEDFFGKTPRSVMTDHTVVESFEEPQYTDAELDKYISDVLRLEGVAAKDWLTNKVDRSVTGRIAMQQTAGEIQLPLNDCGVFALDFHGKQGVANSLGHAAAVAVVDAEAGSVMAIAKSLTNLVFAPIEGGLSNVSLSANWMWPCRNEGEDARLYAAVQAASKFAIDLGLNIPTGKDSLSMTQKYPDGESVMAPGTLLVTAAGQVSDVKKCVRAALKPEAVGSSIVYVDFSGSSDFELGGSAFYQTLSAVGQKTPTVHCAQYFTRAFAAVQDLIVNNAVLSGHDVSGGGLITTLLEMNFANNKSGMALNFNALRDTNLTRLLFSEKPALVLQVTDVLGVMSALDKAGVNAVVLGEVTASRRLVIRHNCCESVSLDINALRDTWFETSYLLDCRQSTPALALERFKNYKNQPLTYKFPDGFCGTYASENIDPHRKTRSGVRAAIIREKGSNGDREMAYAMHLAGFDVRDVTMTDLASGRETMEDLQFIVFVGGFANSDVLGSAKGWAGTFLYNEKAYSALQKFYARADTMSLGVCNGCQLMAELGLIKPNNTSAQMPKMLHNTSGKFESTFVGVDVEHSPAIMFKSLESSKLGIWVSHGEGRFELKGKESDYNIALKYSYAAYPANPNGSDYATAGICSADGRHLAMMPHLERATKPWHWAFYPADRAGDELTPWIEAFCNAMKWCQAHK
ncbi:MAG: phosphoribosylformylglycinamidine synthase [Mucinivorans sp.]